MPKWKVATFNVNSLRRRLPVVMDWLETHQPDVMCLQETKVQDEEFPLLALQATGYHVAFRGMKAYNGVATFTRREPEKVMHGLHEGPDNEDVRILQVVVDGIAIVNSYIPQGHKVGSDKYAGKLKWFERIRTYFGEQLDVAKPSIWLGDLNVAPEPIDVYHPDRRLNDPDYHIDARNAYKQAVAWGWVDVFRKLHPDKVLYTYWDYFRGAFENNWGWRIDHILATPVLAELCREADADLAPRRLEGASDHTIMWAEFER